MFTGDEVFTKFILKTRRMSEDTTSRSNTKQNIHPSHVKEAILLVVISLFLATILATGILFLAEQIGTIRR